MVVKYLIFGSYIFSNNINSGWGDDLTLDIGPWGWLQKDHLLSFILNPCSTCSPIRTCYLLLMFCKQGGIPQIVSSSVTLDTPKRGESVVLISTVRILLTVILSNQKWNFAIMLYVTFLGFHHFKYVVL